MDDVILLPQRFDGVGLWPVDAMPMVGVSYRPALGTVP